MLRAAPKMSNVKTPVGNQGHCADGARKLCEMSWNGDVGQVREVHVWTDNPEWPPNHGRSRDTPPIPQELDWYLWLSVGPERPFNPTYVPGHWRDWHDFGGGSIGDMGCQVADAGTGPCATTQTAGILCNSHRSKEQV